MGIRSTAVTTPMIIFIAMLLGSIPKKIAEMATSPSTRTQRHIKRCGRVKGSSGFTSRTEAISCFSYSASFTASPIDVGSLFFSLAFAPPAADFGFDGRQPAFGLPSASVGMPRTTPRRRRVSMVAIFSFKRARVRSDTSFLYPAAFAKEKNASRNPSTKIATAFSRLMFVKRSASPMGSTMLNAGTASSPLTPKLDKCVVSQTMYSAVDLFLFRAKPSVDHSFLTSS